MVVALAGLAELVGLVVPAVPVDPADSHSIPTAQPARSPDYQPSYASENSAPKSGIADLVLVADTAEADLADNTQTVVGLPAAADTASSSQQDRCTLAAVVAVAVASTEAASAVPVLEALAASS